MHKERLRIWYALHRLKELLGGQKSGHCHRCCQVGFVESETTNLGTGYVIVMR
jgi:hypothetical protein